MRITIEQLYVIARVCHEANRAYCLTLGDDSQAPWDAAPEWQQGSALSGVNFHLERLDRGLDTSPMASHENWTKDKLQEGWIYGPTKDFATKQHPCLVPYDQLPVEQRMKDYIFCGIVKAFYLVWG